MQPRNLVVVHRCSETVREMAGEALRERAAYDECMRLAQEHLDGFIRKRDYALHLAGREYPPLADDKDPSVFQPRQGVVVTPVVNETEAIAASVH